MIKVEHFVQLSSAENAMANLIFIFFISVLNICGTTGRLTIVAITEGGVYQKIHASYINASAQFIKNSRFDRSLKYVQIDIEADNAQEVTDKICQQIDKDNRTAFVISLAKSRTVIETVKTLSGSMSMPTMQINYKHWTSANNDVDQNFTKPSSYATFTPPEAVFINVLSDVFKKLAVTGNVAVLYDEHHGMDPKFTTVFANKPINVKFLPIQYEESLIDDLMNEIRSNEIRHVLIMASVTNAELYLLNMNNDYVTNGTYKWFIVTKDPNPYLCEACFVNNVLWIRPNMNMSHDTFQDFQDEVVNPVTINMAEILIPHDKMLLAFYFDLVSIANRTMMEFQEDFDDFPTYSCQSSNNSNEIINLIDAISDQQYWGAFGAYAMDSTKNFYQNVQVTIGNVYDNTEFVRYIKTVAKWDSANGLKLTQSEMFGDFTKSMFYKIAIVVQPPFIERYKNSDGEIKYRGYCIEMIKELAGLNGFTYDFYEVADQRYGLLNSRGDWDGLIRDLIYGDADMALGTVRISSDAENYVDLTIPFHQPVGHLILLRNTETTNTYFQFMEVLTPNVWYCIVGAFFVTAFFLFMFDRYCPYGKHEKKKFTYTQSMWYCLTSVIPQGGPDAPKNTSCKVVAATWWLFSFIIISAYTANLAATLTLTQMQAKINSLEDLAAQSLYRYGAVRGTEAEKYFQRMMATEKRFYEYNIWQLEAMPMTMSPTKRASMAVWDYPISDKFTNIWKFMTDYNYTLLPKTVGQALEWVLETTQDKGFAYIGEATHIKYLAMTDCRYQAVGSEFDRKPYGIAVQQKSKIKSGLNMQIMELTRNGWLPNLQAKWWKNYPNCSSSDSQDTGSGISVANLMGLFMVVGGLLIICVVTLLVEFLYYEEKLCVRHYRENHPAKGEGADKETHHSHPNTDNKNTDYDVQRFDAKTIPYVSEAR